jgi:hypothetical protein
MKNNKMRSVAAAAAIASVSAVALASLGAGNAAAGKLPGGFTTQTLADGTKVEADLVFLATGFEGKDKLRAVLPDPFRSLVVNKSSMMPLYRYVVVYHLPLYLALHVYGDG